MRRPAENWLTRLRMLFDGKIVSGELQQDDLLPQESKLAEELGVGLPGLREALRILESESLIIVERGAQGGARIQAPTAEAAARPASVLLQIQDTTLEDVYDTQDILEAASARRLAAEGTRRDHRKLGLPSMSWPRWTGNQTAGLSCTGNSIRSWSSWLV